MSGETKELMEGINVALKTLTDSATEAKAKGEENDAATTQKIEAITKDIGEKFDLMEKGNKEANDRVKELEAKAYGSHEGGASDETMNAKAFDAMLSKNKGGRHQPGSWTPDKHRTYKEMYSNVIRKGAPDLGSLVALGFEPDSIKVFQEGIDADGGYLVPPEYQAEIIASIKDTSPIRQLADVMTISSDKLEQPVYFDDIDAVWAKENNTTGITAGANFDLLTIDVHKLFAKPAATPEFLEDAAINAESWLNQELAGKFSRTENTAFVTGDGVGKPRGFLDYASGTAYGQVERVTSATSATLAWSDLFDLLKALKTGYHQNAAITMGRAAWFTLLKEQAATSGEFQISVGVNGPSLTGGQRPGFNFLGYPVVLFEDMPTVAANALSVAVADWRKAYKIVDRSGINILRDPYSSDGSVLFKSTKRTGGGVANSEAIKLLAIKA